MSYWRWHDTVLFRVVPVVLYLFGCAFLVGAGMAYERAHRFPDAACVEDVRVGNQ